MTANIERMMYVGERPWHNEGIYVGDKEVTAAEALRAADLDWTVSLRGLWAVSPGLQEVQVSDRYAIVRDDTNTVLDIVSERYTPLQNREAFRFFDAVVGEGQAIYHTAGSLGRGEKVWILAKLPDSIDVRGDEIEEYLLLGNSFDRSLAFRMFFTPIRVVCQNTLNFAYGREGGYSVPHVGNVHARLSADDARAALGLASRYYANLKEAGEFLASKQMASGQLDNFLKILFPPERQRLPMAQEPLALPAGDSERYVTPSYVQKHRAEVAWLFEKGKGNNQKGIRHTRWAALNAVVEWADYVKGWDRLRANSLLFGAGQRIKQRAWNLLIK